VHFVPAQAHLIGYRLLAGHLQPLDGEGFEQGGETYPSDQPHP